MTSKTDKEARPGERLAKRMARAGVCSRREAEKLIEQGRVTVDGNTVSTPAFNVTENNLIALDGEPVGAKDPTRLWLFHKPAGLVTTNSDEKGRPTIFSVLPENLPRVMTIGRLDINTEGLLLLTNDGMLARTLELPSTGWIRRYRARIYGKPTPQQLKKLANGITVDGVRYGSIDVEVETTQGANSWVSVRLKEGKNREIRKAFEVIDCQVNRLIRTSYGPFQLGNISAGEIKDVPQNVLRESIGKKLLSSIK